jgi:hypothetical protein
LSTKEAKDKLDYLGMATYIFSVSPYEEKNKINIQHFRDTEILLKKYDTIALYETFSGSLHTL